MKGPFIAIGILVLAGVVFAFLFLGKKSTPVNTGGTANNDGTAAQKNKIVSLYNTGDSVFDAFFADHYKDGKYTL